MIFEIPVTYLEILNLIVHCTISEEGLKGLFIFYSDTLSTGECQDVGDSAAQWFSKYLGIECRLYYVYDTLEQAKILY